jgi:hypothetical protein
MAKSKGFYPMELFDKIDAIASKIGLDHNTRSRLKSAAVQVSAAADADEAEKPQARASQVHASLVKSGFEPGVARHVTRVLIQHGHAKNDISNDGFFANADELTPVQRDALKLAARLDIPVSGMCASRADVDAALAKKNLSIEERIAAKSTLARAGIID